MKAIHATELKRMLAADPHPTLINTLPEKSFPQTRIPESINIPQDQDDFVKRVEQSVGNRHKPVVVYCANEQCDSSTMAARKLEEAGFSSVYDFEGGAKEWQESGEKLQAVSS